MANEQSNKDLSIETAAELFTAIKATAGEATDLVAGSAGPVLLALAQAYAAVEAARPKSPGRATVLS